VGIIIKGNFFTANTLFDYVYTGSAGNDEKDV
jgi:hypothetical protein